MKKKFYSHLPTSPGVYLFMDRNSQILYIGKAINLRNRVRNYFTGKTKDMKIIKLLEKVRRVDYIAASSEIESLLLEAKLIKEHQPRYNSQLKDDKRYLYVGITKEEFPRIRLLRQPEKNQTELLDWFGPFPSASSLKEVLRLVRRIFPYCSCKRRTKKPCFYYHLKLCPAPHLSESLLRSGQLKDDWSSSSDGGTTEINYQKTIKNIRLFLNGRINFLVKDLTKQMQKAAQEENFEEAANLKRQIQMIQRFLSRFKKTADEADSQKSLDSLRKILVRYSGIDPLVIHKIEAYDVANLGKKIVVGSMAVFISGEPDTAQYRQFKIITSKQDDPASLKHIVSRRLNHQEWVFPQVILVDGGKAQVSAVFAALKETDLHGKIAVLGLAKKKETIVVPLIDKGKIRGYKGLNYSPNNPALKLLQHARDEAHRFAQWYYHKVQKKSLID